MSLDYLTLNKNYLHGTLTIPRLYFADLTFFLLSTSALNSDHSVIIINLNFTKKDKGPGYFKLNNALLLDTEYQNIIKASIQEIVSFTEHANPNVLREIIQGMIRDETIKYASFKKKTALRNEREIYSKIEDLE